MGKMLYLECSSGISGDMAVAALLDAGASEDAVRAALASLPVDGFEVRIDRVVKSGLDVCDFDVVLDAAHENHDHDLAYLHGPAPAPREHVGADTSCAVPSDPRVHEPASGPHVHEPACGHLHGRSQEDADDSGEGRGLAGSAASCERAGSSLLHEHGDSHAHVGPSASHVSDPRIPGGAGADASGPHVHEPASDPRVHELACGHLHGRSREGADDSGHVHVRVHDHGEGGLPGHSHGAGHGHEHRGMAEVNAILEAAVLTEGARALARRIFELIAQAEAEAHGVPVDQVHFHEVGAVDSIADIVAAAVALDDLAARGIGEVVVTELAEGRGTVRCQHGLIPVPAPAVVNIVRAAGLPLRLIAVEGELVTPTGAAIAAAARTRAALPERFVIERVGMGAGKRAYDTPGILRALVIEEA